MSARRYRWVVLGPAGLAPRLVVASLDGSPLRAVYCAPGAPRTQWAQFDRWGACRLAEALGNGHAAVRRQVAP